MTSSKLDELHTRSWKGRRRALEAARIWLQLHHTSPTIFPSPTSRFTFTINLQIVPIYPPPWKWKHHAWEYIEIPCILPQFRGLPRGALTSSRLFSPSPTESLQKLDARKISRNGVRNGGKKNKAYRYLRERREKDKKIFDSKAKNKPFSFLLLGQNQKF